MYLAEALSADIPVYALQSRASRHPDCGQETLRQMAAYFASLMREVQPRGPYAVAGFSAGGVAAMAIAEELRALGESTDFVGLIDSLTPLSVSVPSPFTTPRRLVRFSRTLVGRAWEVLNRPGPLPELWMARSLGNIAQSHALELPRARAQRSTRCSPTPRPPRGRMKSASTRGSTKKRSWSHEFRGMPIDMVLFRVALTPSRVRTRTSSAGAA